MNVKRIDGFCPRCGADGGILNIGLNNWRASHECPTSWCFGWGFNESCPGTKFEWTESAARILGHSIVEPSESRSSTVMGSPAQTSEVFDRERADANFNGIDPGTRKLMQETSCGPDDADCVNALLEMLL
jgi:hypothetical protein